MDFLGEALFNAVGDGTLGGAGAASTVSEAQGFGLICYLRPYPFNVQTVRRGDVIGSTLPVSFLGANWSIRLQALNDNSTQLNFLLCFNNLASKIRMKCSTSIPSTGSVVFSSGEFEAVGEGNRILRSNAENFPWIPGRKMLLKIGIEIVAYDMVMEQYRASQQVSVAADVMLLFNDELTADVRIIAGAEVFHAHKCILSVCSDVFKAMFQNDMQEKRTNEVCITDFGAPVIKAMLQLMYTDDCCTVSAAAHAEEMLEASFKYQVPRLKRFCERFFASKLSVDNCEELQWMARQRGLADLRRAALYFIAANTEALAARVEGPSESFSIAATVTNQNTSNSTSPSSPATSHS